MNKKTERRLNKVKMDENLKSYKPYSRFITIVSAIVIIIASLDASQVINLFPEYASQINTILVIAGLLAPALSQEARVVRAEDIVKEEYKNKNEITIDLDDGILDDLENDISDIDIVDDSDIA